MACSCGKKCRESGCSEFIAPMSALWQVYDGIGSKTSADIVSVAWEREEGKVFRYDLPVPKRLDPSAAREVAHVVDRIAKFIVWAAGGWKLYLAGPDAVVQPVAKAYTKKGARKFDYEFFSDLYGRPVEAVVVPLKKMPEMHETLTKVKTVADDSMFPWSEVITRVVRAASAYLTSAVRNLSNVRSTAQDRA